MGLCRSPGSSLRLSFAVPLENLLSTGSLATLIRDVSSDPLESLLRTRDLQVVGSVHVEGHFVHHLRGIVVQIEIVEVCETSDSGKYLYFLQGMWAGTLDHTIAFVVAS